MPYLRLAAELDEARRGRGLRLQILREGLAAIDAGLRRDRNIERIQLAELQRQLRASDSRRPPPAELPRAIEKSARKLAQLDQQVTRRSPLVSASSEGRPDRIARS